MLSQIGENEENLRKDNGEVRKTLGEKENELKAINEKNKSQEKIIQELTEKLNNSKKQVDDLQVIIAENANKEEELKKTQMIIELLRLRARKKDEELEGELLIDGYPDLEEIDLSQAKGITKLTINVNCPKITEIILYDNSLTEIIGLENLTNLRKLNFGKTGIREIDISKNIQLEELSFHQNNSEKIKIKEQIVEEDLKEIAEALGIEEEKIEDKPVEEVKKIIEEEAKRLQENEEKIKEKFPTLINEEGKIVDNELNNLGKLNDSKDDVAKRIEKLEIKNSYLENYIEIELGDEALKTILAEIEQVEQQVEQMAQIEVNK
ncbi:1431_t:CDS:2 [Paraglomus occultum]|uniref:1431_t:CDS:1 n=1 Tax=Paraglomus occultum TaxID=144539 RepID=A0A9N8VN78_9GLOM|nr:1431_t:CDS:2 [Paraglomus occultum]